MTFSTRKVLSGFIGIAGDASILSHSCHHMDEHAAPPGMLDSKGSVIGMATTERAYDNWSVGPPGKQGEAIVRALSGPRRWRKAKTRVLR
jgi:hypothetical protein